MRNEETLTDVMERVAVFKEEVSQFRTNGRLRAIEEDILPILLKFSFKAESACQEPETLQEQFIEMANFLRDLCDEVGHPNTLKEKGHFNRIKRALPQFEYTA